MKLQKGKILWVDDEIDHLKSHIVFLEERGYSVTPVANAQDAISLIEKERFDLLLLDEMMAGMDGIQALSIIKDRMPSLPVIMVTKSEEEDVMEEAIGADIEEYLTKPVNPSQIFSSCKRILEKKRISRDRLTREYTSEFTEISDLLDGEMTPEKWIAIHVKLSERQLDLDQHPDLGLQQTLLDQRKECNISYGKFIESQYESWVNTAGRPLMSPDLFAKYILPYLQKEQGLLFILIDNLRLDQWLTLEPLLYDHFSITRNYYFSILPTATPYSRNSIFAGLMPAEIERRYPSLWQEGDDDESSRNRYEQDLMMHQMKRYGIPGQDKAKYIKLLNPDDGKLIRKNIDSVLNTQFVAMVFNFVDILAHRRSDSQLIKEIVPDESAYRSLTRTWFEHSSLFQIMKAASKAGMKIVLTSDHGSIRVSRGTTVYADRQTSTNLRYKYGRGIRGEPKHLFEMKEPKRFGLPANRINTNYLIAKEDFYFVYPTHYHHYLTLYRDSLQHGGISLEEMILPVVLLEERL